MYPPPFFYVHSEIIKLQSIAKMDTWIYIGPILMYLVAQSYIENMHPTLLLECIKHVRYELHLVDPDDSFLDSSR